MIYVRLFCQRIQVIRNLYIFGYEESLLWILINLTQESTLFCWKASKDLPSSVVSSRQGAI